jgi:hypothetical protein
VLIAARLPDVLEALQHSSTRLQIVNPLVQLRRELEVVTGLSKSKALGTELVCRVFGAKRYAATRADSAFRRERNNLADHGCCSKLEGKALEAAPLPGVFLLVLRSVVFPTCP